MKSLLFITLYASFLFSDIYEVNSIKEMDKYKGKNVLFLYDIDNTLFTLDQMLGTDQWFLYRVNQLKNEINNDQEALNKALAEWASVQLISNVREVEKGSSEVIKAQQEDGIICIGFTTRDLTMSNCTIRQLNSIGINFRITSPIKQDLFFVTSQSILFKDGVLFCSATHKGDVLIEFLHRINFIPKKIVFINDKYKHLASVEEGCKAGPFD